ncbi:NAD(P)/FAD-dependent oxidoreductase [Entomospira culicis]|uniref:FAD-dependent oxidoreductase n=1 Tax=Entomospira culicis TaxID=2719989 RepID=A0A968KVQ9_9SPIO|nr:FAD-dependent oxidoreductase [Entomospira culicis]NIZ19184.1 FAD-dependent oxidoreductase [Entomospira culicis]NIZ69398.1 FAD-dependent oxidoreductase [Entomospira culicis]WDI36515.1 FAD-dependent oxidoreductase [Entomospira culicis]WDI38141.1 FAD-dependent oxidoreductase [Entomospira culicis]
MDKKVEHYDVIIIGGGAAGLTAGIYCGRARLNTLLIEKSLMGGLATYTSEIENYPGFPDGTDGHELMDLFHRQAKKFGVKFKGTAVQSVDFSGEEKIVETFRNRFVAKAVILTTGGKPRLTGALNEDIFLYDKGISFCATCDAAANTDKTVMVVGSGDSAIEEGIFLTKFATKVIVSVMHDEGIMDCNEIAKAAAMSNPKMEFIWNSTVHAYEGKERLETVVLKNTKTQELIPTPVDSCFLFIGYLPNTELFKDKIALTPRGNILVNDRMETNVAGVFAAGDVCEKFLKQVATAVGDGAIAGYSCEKYLAEGEVYEEQILNHGKPSLVYLYNGADATSRSYLQLMEAFGAKQPNIRVTCVDTYKSDGLARRLGAKDLPAIYYLEENKIKHFSQDISSSTLENIIQ